MTHSSIVFLGCGRLAIHLAFHLGQVSDQRLCLWNRSPLTPARQALLDAARVHARKKIDVYEGELPSTAIVSSSLVFLTVTDDALAPLAHELALKQSFDKDAVVLHCSGLRSSRELAPLAELGIAVGSCHPLQTFAGIPLAGALSGTFFAIEGHPRAVAAARDCCLRLSGQPIELRTEAKVYYHLSAVMASNLTVALIAMAADIMGEARGSSEAGENLQLLLPLIEGTVRNLRQQGLPAALTGPISRADEGVVRAHLDALRELQPDAGAGLREVYRLLSLRALGLAVDQGKASEILLPLQSLLAKPLP